MTNYFSKNTIKIKGVHYRKRQLLTVPYNGPPYKRKKLRSFEFFQSVNMFFDVFTTSGNQTIDSYIQNKLFAFLTEREQGYKIALKMNFLTKASRPTFTYAYRLRIKN